MPRVHCTLFYALRRVGYGYVRGSAPRVHLKKEEATARVNFSTP